MITGRYLKCHKETEQAQKDRVRKQEEVWEVEDKEAAVVVAVVLLQDPVETVSAQTARQKYLTSWGLPAMK